MAPPPGLPPKKDVALALLRQSSVFIHLDPRAETVRVPVGFKKQPQLVLQVGLNMPVPIRDLDVGDEAISCTLSFNRTPHFCWIPWSSIFALIGDNGPGMVWPDDVPKEVTAQQQKQQAAPKLRAVPESTEARSEPAPEAPAAASAPAAAEPAPKKKRSRKAKPTVEASAKGEANAKAETEATPRTNRRKTAEAAPAPKRKAASADTPAQSSGPASTPTPESKPRRELPPYLRVIK